jgi:uncharacterized protein
MAHLVLSMDGGGIRGVLTARLLERLEASSPFLHKVELFAGTSTGSILALAMAQGMTPTQLVALYVENGDEIFARRDIVDTVSGPVDELLRANYSLEELKKILVRFFDGRTLGDLQKRVLVPTFDLDNGAAPPAPRHWKPKFFHNYDSTGNDRAESMVDVVLRSCAAPTFFPSHQGYVDGGVVANNPAACALAQAISEGVPSDEIRLLSIGTGFNPKVLRGDKLDWGQTQWLAEIVTLLMDGMTGVVDFQCQQLLRDRYHRLDTVLAQVINLDDVARVSTLLAIADALPIEAALTFISQS